MTLRIVQTLLLLIALYPLPSLSDHPPEFEPVVQIFSGLSHADRELIKAATTPDFLLLEMGEVWDLDFLLTLVEADGSERSNYFSVISVNRFDGASLINYWNKARIVKGDTETHLAWLESVVVVETDAGWKLQQMHSTRTATEQIPDDAEFELLMIDRPSPGK